MSSPSWLSTSAPAAAAPAPATIDPLSIESSNDATAGTSASTDEKDLPSIILMMRLLNMGAAAGLITVSVRTKRTNGIMSSSEGHWSKKFDLWKRENAESVYRKDELWYSAHRRTLYFFCILYMNHRQPLTIFILAFLCYSQRLSLGFLESESTKRLSQL